MPEHKTHWEKLKKKYLKKINSFYGYYIYEYKRDIKNKTYFDIYKTKKYAFLKLFLAEYINHSTLFFIFPWFLFTKKDIDGYFPKLLIIISYILLFMYFNTLTFIVNKKSSEFPIINNSSFWDKIIFPFGFLYFPINFIKKNLTKTAFYLHVNESIKFCKLNYKRNMMRQNAYLIKIHEQNVKIRKFRNNIKEHTKVICLTVGIIFTFIMLVNVCFTYDYNNYFTQTKNNFLWSVFSIEFISSILILISTLNIYYNFDNFI